MNNRSRLILALAALCVIGLFVTPFIYSSNTQPDPIQVLSTHSSKHPSKQPSAPVIAKPVLSMMKSFVLSKRFVVLLVAVLGAIAVAVSFYFLLSAATRTRNSLDGFVDPDTSGTNHSEEVVEEDGWNWIIFAVVGVVVVIVIFLAILFGLPKVLKGKTTTTSATTTATGTTTTPTVTTATTTTTTAAPITTAGPATTPYTGSVTTATTTTTTTVDTTGTTAATTGTTAATTGTTVHGAHIAEVAEEGSELGDSPPAFPTATSMSFIDDDSGIFESALDS